jgi:hypothetical protein
MKFRERILGVGMRRRFQGRVDELNLHAGPADTAPVCDDDIATLPSTAQRYLRFMGVVGRPRDWSFRARFVGKFRQQTGQKFMPWEAWQYKHFPGPSAGLLHANRLRRRFADVRCRSLPGRAWPHARKASRSDHRGGRLGAGVRYRGTDDLRQRRPHARPIHAPHTGRQMGGG